MEDTDQDGDPDVVGCSPWIYTIAWWENQSVLSGRWSDTEVEKLTADDGAANDKFGYWVAMDGDTVVTGAPYDDNCGRNSGAVYIYEKENGVISQKAKLTAADGASLDLTNANSLDFEVVFDQDITGFSDPSDVTVSHSGTAHTDVSFTTNSTKIFTVTINNVSGNGSLTLSVNPGVVCNSDGMGNVGGEPSASVWIYNTQGAPFLRTVEDVTSGTAHLTWTNDPKTPCWHLGFAWDFYTDDWVRRRGAEDSPWYIYPPSSLSGDMDLGNSGAYVLWISNYYADESLYPCSNPAALQMLSGTPHKPIDVKTSNLGNRTVRLEWKPEVYGTWAYGIAAYNVGSDEWVISKGLGGESVWHPVTFGSEDFSNGSTELTLPETGVYYFVIAGISWDSLTWGDYALGIATVTETEGTVFLPGGVPLEMVRIPAGSFLMGRYPGEQGAYSDFEDPQHRVEIGCDFYMSKYEVTKAQWQSVMGTTPWVGQADVLDDPNSPAVYISWNDIADTEGFIKNLNHYMVLTGQEPAALRLPSESEWEYACRAGTTTRFYWGDDELNTQIDAYAWYTENTMEVGESYAHVVGQKQPNAWGLYDMSGNVWEWCEDWFHNSYLEAPTDGSSWISPTASHRVIRGGNWSNDARGGRSANRDNIPPDFSGRNNGFRLVRDIE